MRKIQIVYFIFLMAIGNVSLAQNAREEYLKVITERADKIVGTLGLSDSAQYNKVRDLVVNDYDKVNAHHESKQAKIQAAKAKFSSDKAKQEFEIAKIEEADASKLQKLNNLYVRKLSKILTKEQVEGVKNGMTYSVLPKTYIAFQEMIPSLTLEQKGYILKNLTEARDLAMAQPGSKEKHAVFGKYKGKINNYLAKEGYDLKEEGKKWEERIKNQRRVL